MSVIQEAFRLLIAEDKGDLSRFAHYIEQLSHEGVPGKERYLPLRGVSTTTATIRILSEMLDIALSPGSSEHRVSLRGLADQLLHLHTLRDYPRWTSDDEEHAYFTITPDAWKSQLLTTLVQFNRMHSDAEATIRFHGDLDYADVLKVIRLVHPDVGPLSSQDPQVNIHIYFEKAGWARGLTFFY